jgi:DNA adenine methylase
MILFPYLGSRRLFKRHILPIVLRHADHVTVYREPFCGGASIGLMMMSRRPDLGFWLNDRDFTVASLWWSARYRHQDLIALVRAFTPTVTAFQEWHSYLRGVVRLPETADELVTAGFGRLAIQYMSARSWGGGIRGGLLQMGQETVDDRWNSEGIERKISIVHERLDRLDVRISGYDFGHVIEDTTERAILFVDPPFLGYENNYTYEMSEQDHHRLADLLGQTRHRWVLTAGDHPVIRRLYRWAKCQHIGFNNLLIYPRTSRTDRQHRLSAST